MLRHREEFVIEAPGNAQLAGEHHVVSNDFRIVWAAAHLGKILLDGLAIGVGVVVPMQVFVGDANQRFRERFHEGRVSRDGAPCEDPTAADGPVQRARKERPG